MVSLYSKPRKKQAYPHVVLGGNLYIAGFGQHTKYEDPDGCVRRLIELMDGSHTVKNIIEIICGEFPNLTETIVIDAIQDIDNDGFLEEAAHIGEDILNPYQLARYHRNINFFSTYSSLGKNKYEFQKKISDTKVCVLGLGGLGSHIVYDLAGLGIGYIRAVEFDKVDISNLNRQILYNEKDVGLLKGMIAKRRINEFNPKVTFDVIEEQMTCEEDVSKAIDGCDYVILVADRPKMWIARWANAACVRKNTVLLAGGLEAQRAMHYTVIPGVTGCVECWYNGVKSADPVSHALLEERKRLNLTGDNTAIAPLVSIITGMLVAELIRLITGITPCVADGKLITIDFNTMTTSVAEKWSRNLSCQMCGKL